MQFYIILYSVASGKSSIIKRIVDKKFDIHISPTMTQHYQFKREIKKLGGIHSSGDGNIRNTANIPTDRLSSSAQNQQSNLYHLIKYDIWDFGGCDSYRHMRQGVLKRKNLNNKIGLIVFDVGDKDALKKIEKSINQWKNNVQKQYMSWLIIIGNKTDLQRENRRKIGTKQAIKLCNEHNIIYMETTARDEIPMGVLDKAYFLKLVHEIQKARYIRKVNKDKDMPIDHRQLQIQTIVKKHIEQQIRKIAEYKQENKWYREIILNSQQKQKTNKILQNKLKINLQQQWQEWSKKVKVLLYNLPMFFSREQESIREFYKKHIGKMDKYLTQNQEIKAMNKELGYFAKIEAVLLENDKKNNANKITSYQKKQQKQQQIKPKQQQLQTTQHSYELTIHLNIISQLTKTKKQTRQHLRSLLQKQINDQKGLITHQLLQFDQRFSKIYKIYKESQIKEFVQGVNFRIKALERRRSSISVNGSVSNSNASINIVNNGNSVNNSNNNVSVTNITVNPNTGPNPNNPNNPNPNNTSRDNSPNITIVETTSSTIFNKSTTLSSQNIQNPLTVTQSLSETEPILQKQYHQFLQIINDHNKILEKFKSIIKQMQNDMVEFFTELKQEYMGLENGGGSGENGEDMGGIGFVQLMEKLLEFYIQDNYKKSKIANKIFQDETIQNSNDSHIHQNPRKQSAQWQEQHQQQQTKNKNKLYIIFKSKQMKKKFQQKLNHHYEQLKDIGGAKLKKQIIYCEEQRKKIQIKEHQCRILEKILNCEAIGNQYEGLEKNCRVF